MFLFTSTEQAFKRDTLRRPQLSLKSKVVKLNEIYITKSYQILEMKFDGALCLSFKNFENCRFHFLVFFPFVCLPLGKEIELNPSPKLNNSCPYYNPCSCLLCKRWIWDFQIVLKVVLFDLRFIQNRHWFYYLHNYIIVDGNWCNLEKLRSLKFCCTLMQISKSQNCAWRKSKTKK